MRQLSGVDAAFVYGETPSWHMHVSAIVMLDPSDRPGGFSFEEFVRRAAERIHLVPQFRWKLVEVPFGLDRPGWVEDPDFNVNAHIRRIGVPPPGGPEQLGNLVGDLAALKLDRGRPLWEFWIIEGVEGGRVALLAKVHHSIIDGVSGSELATVLFDVEPDPPPPPPEVERPVELVPPLVELLGRGALRVAATPLRIAQFAGQTVRQGITFAGYQFREDTPPTPFRAPRTRFNAELSRQRRFAYADVDLEEVKLVKRAFDVKVNDVVLALCAGALRGWLEEYDEVPDSPLVAQVPVSLRSADDRSEVGTKVGAMFASLATDLDDPVERLLAIYRSTQGAKEMQQALAADKIMGLTETTPPGLIALAARMYTAAGLDSRTPPVMNLIISNVPGPPFPLYCAGARIDSLYPMGPLLYGTGINITVFSYLDRIGFGFMVCRDLVPGHWLLAEGVRGALDELVAAAEKVAAVSEAPSDASAHAGDAGGDEAGAG